MLVKLKRVLEKDRLDVDVDDAVTVPPAGRAFSLSGRHRTRRDTGGTETRSYRARCGYVDDEQPPHCPIFGDEIHLPFPFGGVSFTADECTHLMVRSTVVSSQRM